MYYTQIRKVKNYVDKRDKKSTVKTARIVVAEYYGFECSRQRLVRNLGPKRGKYVRNMGSRATVGNNKVFTRHYANDLYARCNYRTALVPGDKRFVVTNDGNVVQATVTGRWLLRGIQTNSLVDYNVEGDCSCCSRGSIDYTDMFRTKHAAMRIVFKAKEHNRVPRTWNAYLETHYPGYHGTDDNS